MVAVVAVRTAVIGAAAVVILAVTLRRGKGAGDDRAPKAATAAAPSKAEVLAAQEMAKKLVVDMDRVRKETEAMIKARAQAELARQAAVAAELAAKEALAAAEQREKEAAARAGGGGVPGSERQLAGVGSRGWLQRVVQLVAGVLLLLGCLLAAGGSGGEEIRRGDLVAAAWVAYAVAMATACLYA